MKINDFGLKFIDIMIGMVLGLGFQWWTSLHYTWQFVAFIFVYIDIIDYWIDYAPFLKRYPPKREIDIMIDVVIMFNLFLYIFSSQKESIFYFFISFVLLRVLDMVWIGRAIREYPHEKPALLKWIGFNITEAIVGAVVGAFSFLLPGFFIQTLTFVIVFWIILRILRTTTFKGLRRT